MKIQIRRESSARKGERKDGGDVVEDGGEKGAERLHHVRAFLCRQPSDSRKMGQQETRVLSLQLVERQRQLLPKKACLTRSTIKRGGVRLRGMRLRILGGREEREEAQDKGVEEARAAAQDVQLDVEGHEGLHHDGELLQKVVQQLSLGLLGLVGGHPGGRPVQ